MKNNLKKIALFGALVLVSPFAFAQSAEEIVQKWDDSRSYPNSRSVGAMTVQNQLGVQTTTEFVNYSQGDVNTRIDFTSASVKGQKIVRMQGQISAFFPDSGRWFVYRGAQLRQSVAGSDLSYEDLTNTKTTNEEYNVSLLGTDEVTRENGEKDQTWKIKLEGKSGLKDEKGKAYTVTYPNQIVWISKKDYVTIKAEYYDSNMKLLKQMTLDSYEKRSSKGKEYVIVTGMTFKDMLKKKTFTKFQLKDIDLNYPVDKNTFSTINTTF